MRYAGFGPRFGAAFNDALFVSIGLGAVLFVLYALGIPILEAPNQSAEPSGVLAFIGAGLSPFADWIILAVLVLYHPIFESSPLQGSPGKLELGLKVTDMQGGRIGFLRALVRNVAKILSALFLYIGFIMAGFTAKKQGLHDMIAGCLVVAKNG